MNFIVKDVSPHEVDFRQMIFNSLKEDYPEFDSWITKIKADLARKILVACNDEGRYIAIAIIKPEELENPYFTSFPVTKLSTLKVDEDYRNLGLGTALLSLSIEIANAHNAHTIYLETLPKQDSLIAFLEKNKFARHAETKRGEIIMARLRL